VIELSRDGDTQRVIGVEVVEVDALAAVRAGDVRPQVQLAERQSECPRETAGADVLHHEGDDAEPRVPVVGSGPDSPGKALRDGLGRDRPVDEQRVTPVHREIAALHSGRSTAGPFPMSAVATSAVVGW